MEVAVDLRIFGPSLLLLTCSLGVGCFPNRPTGEASKLPQPASAIEATPIASPPLELGAESAPEPELAPELALELALELAPEPEPEPFAERETVRVDELLTALSEEVEPVAASVTVQADYEAFLAKFELAGSDELYLDFVRVKIAFEATRAGGWWGLAWDITNEQPRSDEIWAHWQTLELGAVDEQVLLPEITAIAECDELSALFAFVTQRIGLSRSSEVGLFWPTGNHTVAVWTINPKSDAPVRVVIPTSQIFLDGAQSLGTEEFNPWKQKNIFDYRRQDAAAKLELPGPLAGQFVLAIREYGTRSQAELQTQRNAKEGRQQWAMVAAAEAKAKVEGQAP